MNPKKADDGSHGAMANKTEDNTPREIKSCAGLDPKGLSPLAAGLAIGIVGDAGVRANAQQPRLFVGMILILIFAEALGLYGLIVGLVVASGAGPKNTDLCTDYA